MLVALLAAGAMVVSDILGTVMVMCESAGRGWLAGLCDMAGWYVAITTTTISVTALTGHDVAEKIWVLILVGAANLFGTKAGQMIGSKITGGSRKVGDLEARVLALEDLFRR